MTRKLLTALAPLGITVGIWQLVAVAVLHLRGVAFPTPCETLLRLAELGNGQILHGYNLYVHILASLQRWLGGFFIASLLGGAYGLLAGRSKIFATMTAGIPQTLLLIPGLAWVPVAILLFGIGETSTIFMISLSAFAPIAINVQNGISRVDPNLLHAAQMMGATPRDLFVKVLIPAALPSILSGLRIGLGTGWRVVVAAEMVVGSGVGLGYSIIQARWTLNYESSFACIVVICSIGLLCERLLLNCLETRLMRYWSLQEKH